MLRWVLVLFALLFAAAANAQNEDDKGFLTRLLQDSLAGEGRVVDIQGFRGALSSEATIDKVTIADDLGVWLTIDNLTMQWNRSALLQGRIDIQKLMAEAIEISRRPVVVTSDIPSPQAQGFSLPALPVAIELAMLEVGKVVLGAPLLGEQIEISLEASARLADGSGDFSLKAERRDGRTGVLLLDTAFQRETEYLSLNLELTEAEGGLAARLLSIPDQPDLGLVISGAGPLNDFAADIVLSTAGVDRLTGKVTTAALAAPAESTPSARQFSATLDGDIAALFAPQYRPFFGNRIRLDLAGTRNADGSLDLPEFSLATQELTLGGAVSLDRDYWPAKIDVTGQIAGESEVLLPLPGEPTRIDRAQLSIQFDASRGNTWSGDFKIDGLSRESFGAEHIQATASGTLQGNVGGIGQVASRIDLDALGLSFRDPALQQALGEQVTGTMNLNYVEGQPLELRGFDFRAATTRFSGNATLSGLATGFETDLDVDLTAQDLSAFSGFAGRPLGGTAQARMTGTVALGGLFDLALEGSTTDLSVAEERLDSLLRGPTRFSLVGSRTTQGTRIDNAMVDNPNLSLVANATLGAQDATGSFKFQITDFALVEPQLPGPLVATGMARMDDEGVHVDLTGTGPLQSRIAIGGLVSGPAAKIEFDASLPDVAALVPQFSGPLAARGTATKSGMDWLLEADLTGPAGTRAALGGRVLADGDVELAAKGTAPLGLSEPFLRPRNLQGQAEFDLRMNGRPGLAAISGTVTARGARFVAPNLRLVLADIEADITLEGGRAILSVNGKAEPAGRVSVNGSVDLNGDFPADLDVTMRGAVFADPALFRTSVDGTLRIRGALRGGARIAGALDLGESNVVVPSSGMTSYGTLPPISHVGADPAVRETQLFAQLGPSASQTDTSPRNAYELGITIRAPSRVFVRGRGIDAELGGEIRLTGTTANIISSGRFDLIRGRLDLLEKRFTLNEGSLQLQGDFDPYLRFVARTETETGTASIIVEGLASAPNVRFESVPPAPEDEVLAQIFFRRDISELSALQALQLANAVATLAGRGGEGVVSRLRRTFGLDDLEITTDESGNTGLRIGKYISDNVYTDVTANNGGVGEISLNIDLTPKITARGSLSSTGESKLGVFYLRDY